MNRRESIASVPGKIILFGEHFVVYGNPAILMAVDLRLDVFVKVIQNSNKIYIRSDDKKNVADLINFELKNGKLSFFDPIMFTCKMIFKQRMIQDMGLDIKIKSAIPNGIGLGSSGAVSVATTAAISSLFKKTNKKNVYIDAMETEKLIHKYSSGADCLISTVGGLVYYIKDQKYKKINYKDNLSFLIIDTGIKHSTKKMVQKVKRFSEKENMQFLQIKKVAYDICNEAMKKIQKSDEVEIGRLMKENHKLLKQIGVTNKAIERIIKISDKAGVFGSKLTGAGGGGSVISLVPSDEKKRIERIIKKQGYDVFPVRIDNNGLVFKKIDSL